MKVATGNTAKVAIDLNVPTGLSSKRGNRVTVDKSNAHRKLVQNKAINKSFTIIFARLSNDSLFIFTA